MIDVVVMEITANDKGILWEALCFIFFKEVEGNIEKLKATKN